MARKSINFTLIELLVILSIIAILSALLIGALKKVDERVSDTNCMSNLKQIGTCIAAYSTDNNGLLPNNIHTPEKKTTFHYLLPYLGIEDKYGIDFTTEEPLNVDVFNCTRGPYQHLYIGIISSYGTNSTILGRFGSRGGYPSKKIGSLHFPSETFVAADGRLNIGANHWNAYNNCWSTFKGGDEDVLQRHDGGVNALYLDFHVSFKEEPSAVNYPGSEDWTFYTGEK